jgi:serine/threonine protein kinase
MPRRTKRPAPVIDLRKTKKILHYRVIKRLGGGGLGEVFLARDLDLKRFVVLKTPRIPDGCDKRKRKAIVERFVKEARAQAKLNHPNVCVIHEFSEAHGLIAMEWIEGESLDLLRNRGELSRAQTLSILIQAADAVSHAHERGVIHRDLSCLNIMATPSGHVKVLDFGLAKILTPQYQTRFEWRGGNEDYAPPEQWINAAKATTKSYIFSFGVVAYRLITNRFPFPRLQCQHGYNLPRLPDFAQHGAESWPQMYLLLNQALQGDPAERLESMVTFRQRLEEERQALDPANRRLAFFDKSVLLRVAGMDGLPGGSTGLSDAQHHFKLEIWRDRAASSATVLQELTQTVLEDGFDQPDRLRRAPELAARLEEIRVDIAARRTDRSPGELQWRSLSEDERRRVVQGVRQAVQDWLLPITRQLHLASLSSHRLVETFYRFLDQGQMERRDAWVLAEACTGRSTTVYSEEPRYERYVRILERSSPYSYQFSAISGCLRGESAESPAAAARAENTRLL